MSEDDPMLMSSGSEEKKKKRRSHKDIRPTSDTLLLPCSAATLAKIDKEDLMHSTDLVYALGTIQQINREIEGKTTFVLKEQKAGAVEATHLVHLYGDLDQKHIVEGAFVKLFGRPKYCERTLYIECVAVRPIDKNDIKACVEHHRASIAALTSSREPVKEVKTEAKETKAPKKRTAAVEPMTSRPTTTSDMMAGLDVDEQKLVNKTRLHSAVFKIIHIDNSDRGVSKAQLKSMTTSLSSTMDDINNITQEFTESGLIYNTVDDDTFKSAKREI